MKPKSMILLAVAGACGLVAMLGVQQVLSGKAEEPKVKILVAKTEIAAGIPLDDTNVGFRVWPQGSVPEGAVTSKEEFAERCLKTRAVTNQPILKSELSNPGETGIEAQIPPGMRVETVAVNQTMTHSGLLKPGNFVDINAALAVTQKGGRPDRIDVKTILECIQVFAVDSQVAGGTDDPANANKGSKDTKNVSFLVYPMQAKLLQLAVKKSNGAISLSLRAKSDKKSVNSKDLTDAELASQRSSLFNEVDEPATVATPTKTTVATPEKPKASFRDALAGADTNSLTNVGAQAVRPVWKVSIYAADKLTEKEFEIPPTAVKTAPASLNEGDSGSGWGGSLLKFFGSRKNTSETNGQRQGGDSAAATTPSSTNSVASGPALTKEVPTTETAQPPETEATGKEQPADSVKPTAPQAQRDIPGDFEVRNWLRQNQGSQAIAAGRFASTDVALKFADSLYADGAEKVFVDPVTVRSREGHPYASALVVRLPKDEAKRIKVRAKVDAERKRMGAESDSPQDANELKVAWE